MYDIDIDPKWTKIAAFHGDLCSCWRCIRYRNGKTVTQSYICEYIDWCNVSNIDIKQHQLDGLAWCLYHEVCDIPNADCRGGIVADEMGLGKTFLMLGCMKVNPKPRTLIVLPPILVSQWVSIITDRLGVSPFIYNSYHQANQNTTVFTIYSQQYVITTYGMLRDKHNNKLHRIRWSRIIFDEGHHLRNNTKDHHGSCIINADIRWILTGTPINNSIYDIHNLCRVIDIDFDNLQSHILRRTKQSVGIILPPIRYETIKVTWKHDTEKYFARDMHSFNDFTNVVADNVDSIIDHLDKTTIAMITRMRQVCILPSLLKKSLYKIRSENPLIPIDHKVFSFNSKIDAILTVIRNNKRNGHKKLIFSHYQGEIDQLHDSITSLGLSCAVIDGRVNKKYSQSLTSDYISYTDFQLICKYWRNNSYAYDLIIPFLSVDVLIVQIQTACEGLNLQQFTEIYFTSPHWNPAIEDQAIARAHRIGQKKTVHVYRFIMDGFCQISRSLDQYCSQVQQVKRDVMESIY